MPERAYCTRYLCLAPVFKTATYMASNHGQLANNAQVPLQNMGAAGEGGNEAFLNVRETLLRKELKRLHAHRRILEQLRIRAEIRLQLKMLSFVMSMHEDLGKYSPVGSLPADLIQEILEHLRERVLQEGELSWE